MTGWRTWNDGGKLNMTTDTNVASWKILPVFFFFVVDVNINSISDEEILLNTRKTNNKADQHDKNKWKEEELNLWQIILHILHTNPFFVFHISITADNRILKFSPQSCGNYNKYLYFFSEIGEYKIFWF